MGFLQTVVLQKIVPGVASRVLPFVFTTVFIERTLSFTVVPGLRTDVPFPAFCVEKS